MKAKNSIDTGNNEYVTRALLDSGSNRSFCTERLRHLLGIDGKQIEITIDTLNGEYESLTHEVDLKIIGKGMKWSRSLTLNNVIVKDTLPVALSTAVATEMDTKTWKHLHSQLVIITVGLLNS